MSKGKYFKIYIIEVALVALIFISAYPFLKVKDLNMDDLKEDIIPVLNEDLKEGTLDDIRKIYGISKADVDDFLYFRTKNNMNPEEILVIKFKDETLLNNNKSKIENVIDNKKNSFKDYNANAYSLIEDNIFEAKGDNLILIIDEDNKNIETIINKNYKWSKGWDNKYGI